MRVAQRIAILLPNLSGGGAERISVNLANNLIERGYSVDLVLLSATGPLLGDLHPKVCIVDLQVRQMRRLLRPLAQYLRGAKPDAMLVCMWPLTVLSVVARKMSGISVQLVLAEHSTWSCAQADYSYLQRIAIRKTMRVLFPKADAVVSVSNGAAEDLATFAGLARKKIFTVYNPVTGTIPDAGVSDQKLDEIQALGLAGWLTADHRVLTVGTLKREKNQTLLLRAFALLLKDINAHLLILGDGHLRAELEGLIDELGLQGHVFMPGFVGDPKPFYQLADLFVLSSNWEGLGVVIIEALAAGTPVVSTDCRSGPREILCDGQYGRLVPVDNATALAAAMKTSLITDSDAAALKARAQDFSIDKAADRYLELLFPEASLKGE